MKALKQCLGLVCEAAEAAAEEGQTWAAEVALGVLAAVPRAHGLGGLLARLLRSCVPAPADLAELERVHADVQRCPLVQAAAGELVSELRCAEIGHVLQQRPLDFVTLTSLLKAARGEGGDQESLPA